MTTAIDERLREGLTKLPSTEALDKEIAAILGPLQHRHEQLTALEEDIDKRYNAFKSAIKTEREKVERIMQAAGFKRRKNAGKAHKRSDGGDPQPSPESVERLIRWLADEGEGRNYEEIEAGLEIANSTANKQVKVARDLGLVRITHHGGKNGRMMYFGVFEDAVAKLDGGEVQWP